LNKKIVLNLIIQLVQQIFVKKDVRRLDQIIKNEIVIDLDLVFIKEDMIEIIFVQLLLEQYF
jgi:hypothetical protein